jgi:PAS domain S-box-containing protein
MINTKNSANEKIFIENELEINGLLAEKILKTAPGLLFILDIKTQKVIYTNYSQSKFLGYSTEEIHSYGSEVGKNLLHPDDIIIVNKSIDELNNSTDGTLKSLEIRLKDKNRKYHWFEVRLTIFTSDADNNAVQIIGLLQNIDDNRKIKDALSESELSYRNLFNTIEDAIYIQDETGAFLDVNNGAIKMYGYQKEEFVGQGPEFLSAPDKNEFELVKQKLADALQGIPQQFEFWGKKKDGTIFLKDVKIYKGSYFGKDVIIAHAQDITKRKKEEKKMQATLAEKNALLREVHHRVKNNLQAMIYLIEMQIDKLDDEKMQIFLRELQEQARTMSLVYEQLYQSDYLAQVDMNEYLNNLTSNVIQVFGLGKDISFNVNANDVLLDVETAMPCGLIVNELLTNSLKYAFTDGLKKTPIINVLLKNENNVITILVSDNGIGLPANLDWENTDSLGLKLVNFWVKYQLAGSIKVDLENGTNYIISFGYEEK